jgi:hypothetical protein
MGFKNLEQRMAQTYIDTFPEFRPVENGWSVLEQESFYKLMHGLYLLAHDEPGLFVNQLHEDDFYTNRFNKSSEGKPDLQKNMKLMTKSVDDLLEVMYQMGVNRTAVKLNKRQSVILKRLGVNDAGVLPAAWVWMATQEGANLLAFSRCLFDKHYPYTRVVFARLLGDSDAYHKLEKWLIEHDYTRYEYLDGKMSLDYANLTWDKKPPAGGFQFKIRHTGISLGYDKWVQNPAILGLCIPNGLKDYLGSFQDMEESLKEFVITRTKKCDKCDYCIQTDKTRSRPRAYITTIFNKKTYYLCPLFPGYSYCWSSINDDVVNNSMAIMSFMDSFLKRR